MQFLKFNLVNKHGVSRHQGDVLIEASQVESVRSFVHSDHIYFHHDEVGSIVTTKTGDKHFVSQHVDEIADMLQFIAERDDSRAVTWRGNTGMRRSGRVATTPAAAAADGNGMPDISQLAATGAAGRSAVSEPAPN